MILASCSLFFSSSLVKVVRSWTYAPHWAFDSSIVPWLSPEWYWFKELCYLFKKRAVLFFSHEMNLMNVWEERESYLWEQKKYERKEASESYLWFCTSVRKNTCLHNMTRDNRVLPPYFIICHFGNNICVLLCVTLQYQCIINDSFPIIPFTTLSTLYSFNLFFSCLNKGEFCKITHNFSFQYKMTFLNMCENVKPTYNKIRRE